MSTSTRMVGSARTAVAACIVVATMFVLAAPAADAAPFQIGIQSNNTMMDPRLTSDQRAANFDQLDAAGVQILRISLHWDWVAVGPCAGETPAALENPEHPCYSWSIYDQLAQQARDRGIDIVASVSGVPPWLFDQDPSYMGSSAAQFDKLVPLWAAFQKAAATRYNASSAYGPINKWTVHNEPNSLTFWKPYPNPLRYARLFRETAPKIKEGNPNALVAAGPTGPRSTMKPGKFLPVALKAMTKNGSRPFLDAWAHNPYPGTPTSPRLKSTSLPNIGIANLGDLVHLLDSYKVSRGKPIWATEFAWETRPHSHIGVTTAQQGEFMADALEIMERTGRIRMAIWYVFQDPVEAVDWQSGFLTSTGSRKPGLDMYLRPISRSTAVAKRKQAVTLWGASLSAPGSQKLQYSFNGSSWKKVPGQHKDANGTVTGAMRAQRTFFVRTLDAGGPGPKLKVTVRK